VKQSSNAPFCSCAGLLVPQIGFAGQGGLIYTILVAVGGAVVLTGVVRALKRA